jgi:hypothetical protein|tara:strand:- start:571 stop:693 length:123 start_codon:yes stop_codon:yes gene_type:complete
MQKIKDFAQSAYDKWSALPKKHQIAVAIGVLIIISIIIGV